MAATPLSVNITTSVAVELAAVERAKILRGEAGIGGKKRKDMPFAKAVEEFMAAAAKHNRPNTLRGYQQHLDQLADTFGRH